MADLSAVVTDTHPLLFHAAGGARLGKRARRAFQSAEDQRGLIYVPAVVMWECSLLCRIGRVDLGRSIEEFFDTLFTNPAYQPLPLDAAQIYIADRTQPNDDPFDSLVCAAALSLELPLVTRDGEIQDSRIVKVVW